MECVLRPNSEDEDITSLVTTVFTKDETEYKTEKGCGVRDQVSPPSLYNVRVKDEPVVDLDMPLDVIVDVEVTCLTERALKDELVAGEETGGTGDTHIVTSHSDQWEVCITKESCSSPSVDGSIVGDEDPYECNICQKILKSRSSLTNHILIHDMDKTSIKKKTNNKFHDEEIIFCKICGQQFPSLSTYLKHRQNHLLERPFTCEICEKEFKSKFLLSNHERIHTGEKPYACDACDKRFSEQVNLNRHKRTHSGAKPHQCDFCQKNFSLKHNLTLHMRSHTKERPFECKICNMRFPHTSDLKRHQRSHTGEKLFSCDICKKSFSRKYYLPYHMQSHNNHRPVSCEICEKKFMSIYDCKKHLKVHMAKKSFKCHICKDSFTHKLLLSKHLQQKHP